MPWRSLESAREHIQGTLESSSGAQGVLPVLQLCSQ